MNRSFWVTKLMNGSFWITKLTPGGKIMRKPTWHRTTGWTNLRQPPELRSYCGIHFDLRQVHKQTEEPTGWICKRCESVHRMAEEESK